MKVFKTAETNYTDPGHGLLRVFPVYYSDKIFT